MAWLTRTTSVADSVTRPVGDAALNGNADTRDLHIQSIDSALESLADCLTATCRSIKSSSITNVDPVLVPLHESFSVNHRSLWKESHRTDLRSMAGTAPTDFQFTKLEPGSVHCSVWLCPGHDGGGNASRMPKMNSLH